jgi:hypothetical protein
MLNELHPAQEEVPLTSKHVRTISVRLIHPKNKKTQFSQYFIESKMGPLFLIAVHAHALSSKCMRMHFLVIGVHVHALLELFGCGSPVCGSYAFHASSIKSDDSSAILTNPSRMRLS